MSPYNELPFVVVNNNGVDVKVYDVDSDKYVINESKVYKNISYVSLDGNKEGRMKTRHYAQYTGLTGRTTKGSAALRERPDYYGCTLDERFNSFDKWVEWAETKVGFMCVDDKGNIYQLDKDLMNYPNKNKHYSPDNCVFLPPKINSRLGTIHKSVSLDSRRSFFLDVFEDYFTTLDEDALGKLIEICDHNNGLNQYKLISDETRRIRNDLGTFSSTVSIWRSDVDINSSVIFQDGKYKYQMLRGGKQVGKGNYKCPKECIKDLITARLSLIDEVLDNHMEDITDCWEQRENCLENIKLRRFKLEEALVKMEKGETKVLKYIPTYF